VQSTHVQRSRRRVDVRAPLGDLYRRVASAVRRRSVCSGMETEKGGKGGEEAAGEEGAGSSVGEMSGVGWERRLYTISRCDLEA
jgi:hypothetical protein